jgi:hypothetical protein
VLASLAAAGYSASLFRLAEGRVFWQCPLLLTHLLAASLAAGAAALVLVEFVGAGDLSMLWGSSLLMAAGVALHALVVFAELFGAHTNLDTARAARLMTRGDWSIRFWGLVGVLGIAAPLAIVWLSPPAAAIAAVLVLLGLWVYEDLWVKAGQSIPLS